MKNTYTYIDHISSHYVGNDCVQLMIGYKNFMTMFNKGGIQYHKVPNSSYDINSYLSDDRKKMFPYNDIPLHYGRVGLFKYTYTNQILNFEESYITISDDTIIEIMAILDKDDAFVVRNVLPIRKKLIRVTREQLEDLFSVKNENGEMSFVMQGDGYLWGLDCCKNLMTEDEDIPKIGLDLGGIVLVKITNGHIRVQLINSVNSLGPNQYEVIIADLPLMDHIPNKESLRMLNIVETKEQKISRRLNPNIDYDLVRANKRLVKRLK